MTSELQRLAPIAQRLQGSELQDFVERVLRDFSLLDAFERRSPTERLAYLSWIAGAVDPGEEDRRIARLLDDLAAGRSLASDVPSGV